jgi:nucleoside-diphosphate-sugar epimerase
MLIVREGRVVREQAAGVIECDFRNPPADLYDRLGRPDVLVHLAWGGLPHYKSLHHFEDELPIQYAFLKRLITGGLRRCVVAGTCLEYGNQEGELSEDCPALPTTAYAFAKDCLRRQLELFRGAHQFELTWARLFYTYGEGQAPTSLYSLLQAAVARGDRTFDMSGGEQVRDYLPVRAVARALVDLALAPSHHGVVNVCAGHGITVRRLVEGWLEENGWDISLNFGRLPYPDYEPHAFWGARDKLISLVGGHDVH